MSDDELGAPRPPTGNDAPVLEYAGPALRRPRAEVPLGATAITCGALVTLACSVLGQRSAPFVLTVPLGIAVGLAAYFVLTAARRKRAGPAAAAQLVVALALVVGALLVTFARGGEERGGPGGVQYWVTYNPGYRFNPRWAMRYLWLAGVGAAWFLGAALWVVSRHPNGLPPHPASSTG